MSAGSAMAPGMEAAAMQVIEMAEAAAETEPEADDRVEERGAVIGGRVVEGAHG